MNPQKSESQAAAPAAPEVVVTLYKSRKKIHPRSVTGVFANWRWILVWFTQLLYYGLPWLPWNDRQAVLLSRVADEFGHGHALRAYRFARRSRRAAPP